MGQEWSVYRTENKYLLPWSKAIALQCKLNCLLKKDAYSGNQNGYMVRSLYFDSLENHDLVTKLAGTEVRRKIRIRIYDPDDQWCKLEVKEKNGDAQHKISLQISRADAKNLIAGDYSVLRQYFHKSENAIKIYSIMVMGCYKPVTLIEYRRIAYTHLLNSTRITFDFDVRSSESYFDIFAKNPLYSQLFNDLVILEVKYNGKLLKYISNVLRSCDLNRISVSKYCMGRKNHMEYFF